MYGGNNNHHQQLSPDTTTTFHHLPTSQPQLTRFSSAPSSFFHDPDFFPTSTYHHSHIIHQQQTPHIVKQEPQPPPAQSTTNNDSSGGLLRQSSSPADFFASLFNETVGFPSYKGDGGTRVTHASTNLPMPSIPEFQHHDDSISASLDELFGNSDLYAEHWQGNDASVGQRRGRDSGNEIAFGAPNDLGNRNGYTANAANGLIHQMSLPNTSSEHAAMDKYLQFQDSTIPCSNTRAKRGFATHPRSIAERVRRTKISDRMRKLQQLFPEIDKQTNTAQMLDMATDYIKDLEKEVQSLNDIRNKCICPKK